MSSNPGFQVAKLWGQSQKKLFVSPKSRKKEYEVTKQYNAEKLFFFFF